MGANCMKHTRGGLNNIMDSKKEKSLMIHIVYGCIIILLLTIIINMVLKASVNDQKLLSDSLSLVLDNSIVILVSVICSILASIVYASITEKRTANERAQMLKEMRDVADSIYNEKINSSVELITAKMSQIGIAASKMTPKYYFESGDQPNKEFNEVLNNSICKSRKFSFLGVSARFSCKRLHQLVQQIQSVSNLEVEIFIVDPANNDIFLRNKSFYMNRERAKNPDCIRSWDEIVREEKIKSLACLCSLSNLSKKMHKIDVYIVSEIPFVDVEITEDLVILEFFRTRRDYKKYPLTIIYDKNSAYYESYEFYLDWEKDRATPMRGDSITLDWVLDLGRQAGIEEISLEMLQSYCEEEIVVEHETYI